MASKQVLVRLTAAIVVSLFFAETLALLHVAGMSIRSGTNVFRLPGVLPVATFGALAAAVLIIPLAFWALRIGTPRLITRVTVLWLLLAVAALGTSVLAAVGAIPFIALFAVLGVAILGVVNHPELASPN